MDVILKDVKEKQMKLIRALAEELELQFEKQEKPVQSTFEGQKHRPTDTENNQKVDIKMTINDIDKLWG